MAPRSARCGARSLTAGTLAAALVLAASSAALAGLPGHLDRSFNGTGRAAVRFGARTAEAHAVALQGHAVVAAGVVGEESDEDIAVVRFTPDGALDRTFGGGDGRFVRDVFGGADMANAVAVLPDGRILVAGQAYDPDASAGRFIVLRLTPDGRPDRTFGGGDGIVVTRFPGGSAFGQAMTMLSDGGFVVCGVDNGPTDSGFALARYRPAGGLDASFGTGGRVVTLFPGQSEAVCRDIVRIRSKVVAVGTAWDGATYAFAVARYLDDGTPDPGFGSAGLATFTPLSASNEATSVVPMPDRGVLVAGSVSNGVDPPDVALLRLSPTGTPDPSFGGGDGLVIDDVGSADQANDLVRQRDGRIVVVGFRNPDMFVARYRPRGARDTSFAGDGVQASHWEGASIGSAVTLDGARIVVVGGAMPSPISRFAAERLFR